MATGSIQEKNNKYYMVFRLPTENGRTKQKWECTGLTIRGNKKQAIKMLNERLAELNKYDLPYCKLSVADYFEEWLIKIQYEVKPTTYRSYFGNMHNHIIPYFKAKKILLQELKPYQLEDYYLSKLKENSKINSTEALSFTTIRHHHQNISKALNDALRRGLIIVNPASAAKLPKNDKKYKAEFLPPNQMNDLIELFKGSTVEIPVLLCAIYGLRRSECLGLKWHNVDLVNKTITICETLQQHTGGNYTDTPKTESSYRVLPISDSVCSILLKHKAHQEKRKSLLGNYYVNNDYVCTWDNGEVITPNYLSRTFHSVISKSNLPQIRLHDLRHSVATNLLNSGKTVVEVQEWLGHSTPTTTLNVYSHTLKTSKTHIAESLDKMLNLDSY